MPSQPNSSIFQLLPRIAQPPGTIFVIQNGDRAAYPLKVLALSQEALAKHPDKEASGKSLGVKNLFVPGYECFFFTRGKYSNRDSNPILREKTIRTSFSLAHRSRQVFGLQRTLDRQSSIAYSSYLPRLSRSTLWVDLQLSSMNHSPFSITISP
jgi:hypothetical protein